MSASTQHRLDGVGNLALFGAGKMGAAMLQAWIALGLDPKNVAVFEPQPSADIRALAARGLRINPKQDVGDLSGIVLAVKPQTATDIVRDLGALLGKETLLVSIMAGRTLSFLENATPQVAIVRAMPNMPAAIRRGITVAVANKRVTPPHRLLAERLLAATGAVEWVDDETLMDAVTALSGSGPAYVFLLTEALARAGVAAGLPQALAERLARETVAGAGELLHRSDLDPAGLRQSVTSPGGTTAAALEILMAAEGLDPLLRKAVAAATKRSRELAG